MATAAAASSRTTRGAIHPATFTCVECGEAMCHLAASFHRKFKATAAHRLEKIKTVRGPEHILQHPCLVEFPIDAECARVASEAWQTVHEVTFQTQPITWRLSTSIGSVSLEEEISKTQAQHDAINDALTQKLCAQLDQYRTSGYWEFDKHEHMADSLLKYVNYNSMPLQLEDGSFDPLVIFSVRMRCVVRRGGTNCVCVKHDWG
jgi:hypothetical protein